MGWKDGWYETDGTGVGWKADFHRDPGPDRDAPWAMPFPYYTRVQETIRLPDSFARTATPAKTEVNETVAGIEYRRHAAMADNVFTIEESERGIAPEFPNADAPAAEKRLKELADMTVYLRRPDNYTMTDQELDASKSVTAIPDLLQRGYALNMHGRYAEAMSTYDKVIAQDGKNEWAFANRGLSRVWMDDYAGAAKDLDATDAIDPRNAVAARARGLMAERRGQWQAAVGAYTRAIELDPTSNWAFYRRAAAYRALGNQQAALADADRLKVMAPTDVDAYLLRANILRVIGRRDDALAEAAAVVKANPDNVYAYAAAAALNTAFDRQDAAVALYDRAIAIKPEVYLYVDRSEARPAADLARRRADVDAALALDPADLHALRAKADLLEASGDRAGALASLDKAVAANPKNTDLLVARGIMRLKAGQQSAGETDLAAVDAKVTSAMSLNNLCWEIATKGVGLSSALKDCDAALTKEPDNAAALDSRAFVLLRLGRTDEAITGYDRALTVAPGQADSLWGRSIAWKRKGDKTKADADAAAALKADPEVSKHFAGFGVTS